MDFEPWWLIIVPLLFGLGWLAARFDVRQVLSESKNLPDSYFKGLNFLLNEQPDRAIEAFVEVVKLDPETTELHFALGGLFRRRGEIERAIRVHQSLLSRADLPPADREMAQYELAQDFLKAGLLDRAELAFEAVGHTERYAVLAARALIRIYESEHDWPKAITAVRRLRDLVDEPVPQLVHYQCEEAEMALHPKAPQLDKAVQALQEAQTAARALGAEHGSVAAQARILILSARLVTLQGQPDQALSYYQELIHIAPLYTGLIAKDFMQVAQTTGQVDLALQRLQQVYSQQPSIDVFEVLFTNLRIHHGPEHAWSFARDALRAHPSLLALERMLETELSFADQHEQQPLLGQPAEALPTAQAAQLMMGQDLALLKNAVYKQAKRLDRYACEQCGFEAQRFYWQCPGCSTWESYAPKRLEELQ